ncbi:STAS domain-containing protein [Sphingomonas morindae]|uniref:STAS domain-containing protein n=1 Tax=Sphingomonas morindae TaxID=1541170 RepID=A0ABY4X4A0_9SPHN|nr:STAS domain-containing protein [Sphingomonas morindae]USI71710.1 STAS domain-containing protein [Sphingomonas morindae]
MTHQIVLPAQIDRGTAASLAPEIAHALSAGGLELDGREVRRAGQCALQMLLSARKTAGEWGVALLIRPSESLRDAARLAGLEDRLFEEAVA